ncbi:hypothetical protein SDC9_199268 [bioreactor metagenome]|uniref:Uncharacterized protein n=1 Tax=bioreactor metagenome TaxID=1076179 RepID=A0A645IKI6_9ZZZZ
MSERVHRDKGGKPCFITEIVFKSFAGEFRARSRFCSNKPCLFVPFYNVAQERERNPREIGTSSKTTDNNIGIFTGHLHLFFGFQANNRLVQ